ncbi:MAG: GNAT family N-acetyltransferase [Vallitaleaceae bacterium]|jgi:predicted GNAT family N-acyltransferase|nr:GNAT family N-acetyltransferase [Vallitaleaceae bacterium]
MKKTEQLTTHNLDILYRVIPYAQEDYKASLLLRDEILRAPLGMNIFDEDLSDEINQIHFGAFMDTQLIGILVLMEQGSSYKVRQVATKDNYRGLGIGSRLVGLAETWAMDHKIYKIVLHARITAITFYEKLGYVSEGALFSEIGIPHMSMYKVL